MHDPCSESRTRSHVPPLRGQYSDTMAGSCAYHHHGHGHGHVHVPAYTTDNRHDIAVAQLLANPSLEASKQCRCQHALTGARHPVGPLAAILQAQGAVSSALNARANCWSMPSVVSASARLASMVPVTRAWPVQKGTTAWAEHTMPLMAQPPHSPKQFGAPVNS
jgi:hypothetical protein